MKILFTALHFAARMGDMESARALLAGGVDVNINVRSLKNFTFSGGTSTGKVTNDWADGDPNVRTNRHGYAYGVRF